MSSDFHTWPSYMSAKNPFRVLCSRQKLHIDRKSEAITMSFRYCKTGRQQYTILGVRFPPLYNSVLQGRRFLRCGCRGHLTKEHLSMIPPTTSGLGYIAWHLGQVANSIKLLLSTPTSLRIVCWDIGMERARVRSDSIDRTVAQTSKNCLRNFYQ